MTERRFPRTIDSLEGIHEFVVEFLAAQRLDPDLAFDVDLVVEELFTNMVKYSREGRNPIAVGLDLAADGIRIMVRDFDVEPYDVTRARDAGVDRPIEERRAGGLGLHLVRRIADRVEYDYRDRVSTITVLKRIAP
ncbi:MAG TPA: ATP-binding protein [Candidatus Eisenbacteria bacterium]